MARNDDAAESGGRGRRVWRGKRNPHLYAVSTVLLNLSYNRWVSFRFTISGGATLLLPWPDGGRTALEELPFESSARKACVEHQHGRGSMIYRIIHPDFRNVNPRSLLASKSSGRNPRFYGAFRRGDMGSFAPRGRFGIHAPGKVIPPDPGDPFPESLPLLLPPLRPCPDGNLHQIYRHANASFRLPRSRRAS